MPPSTVIKREAWNLVATSGVSEELVFVDDDGAEISSLVIYLGGTIEDADDYTGATPYAATLSGDNNEVATVSIPVPSGEGSTILRLVVDGALLGVGRLFWEPSGSALSVSTFTLTSVSHQFVVYGRS